MASTTIAPDSKSTKPTPLAIPSRQADIPTEAFPGLEKHPETIKAERRDSSVSTPCSAHIPNGFDTDIEAMTSIRSSEHLNKTTTSCTRSRGDDSSVWPGQAHWKQKARAAKINNRSCQCMARLSKRTRITVKIVIVFLIVGIAVGVGFGISKPLGAPIWDPKDH